MEALAGRHRSQTAPQMLTAPGERRRVGNGEVEAHYPEPRVQEPFGLAQREMIEEPQGQGGLDDEIRVAPLPAAVAAPAGRPGSDRFRGHPTMSHRHVERGPDCRSASSPRGTSSYTWVPLRDRCSFGRFQWLISQALSVTYMAGERRLYLERNCRLPESPAHSRRRNREGPASSKGLNSQRGFGPAVEPRRKSRPRSTSLHGSSPCKCQRLSTLRWDRLPPSRPSTKSGARAGGHRLSDRRLHRWLAGTSASAPSSHGAADLLGLNRAHICVRNLYVG